MNSQIKVSVVVPVYNREKYLKQCVDSIVAQTLREIEIILVDDGSTDASPAICDEYAAKDSRVKVIHKQNAGMGAAYNTGMAKAKGEYIGFVESDDWIEPEMYEELYNKAVEQDVDMVKSLFTRVNGEKRNLANIYGNRIFNQRLENLSITAHVMAYKHPSPWSAIYHRSFIERYKIQYPERPGASAQDRDFHWRVITQARSCYLVPKSYYNYRTDAPDSSSNQGYKAAMDSVVTFQDTFKWLLQNDTDSGFMELFYRCAFLELKGHLQWNCRGAEKIPQVRRISRLLVQYFPHVKFRWFSEQEKKEFLYLLRHPIWYVMKQMIYSKESNPTRTVRKFLGIKLTERKRTAQCDKRRLLYLPIKKEIFDKQGSKIFYLGLPLIRTTKKGNVVEKRFLGIRYKTKRGSAKPIPFANDVHLLQIITHANAITNTHRETFAKYKNRHVGKDVVLVAPGSTLNHFEPIEDCVYVGVNKVLLYEKVHFDYLFFQDFAHPQAHEILDLMGKYAGAKKFYGILQDTIRQDWIVPESAAIRDHAERYYVISQWKYPPVHFTYDIANEPFGDCGSVSFAAMQFILWTNPRRIYLIGQDNTTTYFDRSASATVPSTISDQLRGWKAMVKFASAYYPNTEIVSINPVGLKGMFKDVYTKSYLAEHPEIDQQTIEILNK